MARESRRTRDERRHGGTPTLADLAISTPPDQWMSNQFSDCMHADRGEVFECISRVQADLMNCKIVLAQNVSDFFFEHEQEYWTYKTDFPCSSPPFRKFFIEAKRPKRVVYGDRVELSDGSGPERFGFLFDSVDAKGQEFPLVNPGELINGWSHEVKRREVPGARWLCRALPIFQFKGKPTYISCLELFALDDRGIFIHDGSIFVQSSYALSKEIMEILHTQICQFFMPMLLAISFMHCKNVAIDEVFPSREIERERRRDGLKPLVRYSTINIEPMKKVLRTEGQSETEGLKRALHICRGHFSTYSEEKPLFGRIAGTFWIPSHVRGSINEGVVVSDYKVSPTPEPLR